MMIDDTFGAGACRNFSIAMQVGAISAGVQ